MTAGTDLYAEVRALIDTALADDAPSTYSNSLLDGLARFSRRHPPGHDCRQCERLRRSEGLPPDGHPRPRQDP